MKIFLSLIILSFFMACESEKSKSLPVGQLAAATEDYSTTITTRDHFNQLALSSEVPGFGTLSTAKFVLNRKTGEIFFANTKKYPMHYLFVANGLKLPISQTEWESLTYGNNSDRTYLAGNIVAYKNLGNASEQSEIYAIEFYPSDDVSTENIIFCHDLIKKNVSKDLFLAYKPSSFAQEDMAKKDFALIKASDILVLYNSDIYSHLNYLLMNKGSSGKAYGYLRYISDSASAATDASLSTPVEELTYKDIAVFEKLPLEVGVLSAIVTEEYQTPLSHVNLKSQARNIINLVYPKAHSVDLFKTKINQLVSIDVNDNNLVIESATIEEAVVYWESLKRKLPALTKDIHETEVRPSKKMNFESSKAYGAKVANYSEISNLDPKHIKPSFGVPFFYYDQFMRENNIWPVVDSFLKDANLISDRKEMIKRLDEIKQKMNSASVSKLLIKDIEEKLQASFPKTKMRFRSSTNAEDLPGFNGAGLYDSTSFDPESKKKTIELALKKVWSSVWNLKAFDEREIFSINHRDVYMGILISPAFPDEKANGVIISQNIYSPEIPAFYVNTQIGEESVTNPTGGIVSDESLSYYTITDSNYAFTHRYIRYSSISASPPILSKDELEELILATANIDRHFKSHFDPDSKNPHFAVDLEFKIVEEQNVNTGLMERKIHIKQARPYINHANK